MTENPIPSYKCPRCDHRLYDTGEIRAAGEVSEVSTLSGESAGKEKGEALVPGRVSENPPLQFRL